MATVMPEGEKIQKAIQWISASLEDSAPQPVHMLIDKAVL